MHLAGSVCLLSESTAVHTEFSLSSEERCVALCGHEVTRCVSLVISSMNTSGTMISHRAREEMDTIAAGSGSVSRNDSSSAAVSGRKTSSTRKRSASNDTIQDHRTSTAIPTMALSLDGEQGLRQGLRQGRWLKLDCFSGGVLMERTLPAGDPPYPMLIILFPAENNILPIFHA